MEKPEKSELTWDDLDIPCNVIARHKDVEGVTENPPMEITIHYATLNRELIRYSKPGSQDNKWIETKDLVLIEPVTPQANPTPTEK